MRRVLSRARETLARVRVSESEYDYCGGTREPAGRSSCVWVDTIVCMECI